MLLGFSYMHRHELRLLGGSLSLLALLAAAVTQLAFVSALDLQGVHEAHETSAPPLTTLVFAVTAIGASHAIVAVAALAVIGLLALRHWHGALAVGLSIGVTEFLVAAVKHAVERPRPPSDQALAHAADFSFPSGHAAATTAVFGLLVWLALRHLHGATRTAAVIAGAAVILGVGLSRIYLGVHYPTDVAAGWLVGAAIATAAWLGACLLGRALGRPVSAGARRRPPSARPAL